MTDVVGKGEYHLTALQLYDQFTFSFSQTLKSMLFEFVCVCVCYSYAGSRMSANERCSDIMSLAY